MDDEDTQPHVPASETEMDVQLYFRLEDDDGTYFVSVRFRV